MPFCEGPNKKSEGFAKQNFATHSVSVHHSDILHFATVNHTQNIATFTIHIVSLQTLTLTRNRNLRYSAPRILRLNMYRKPHHRFSLKFPLVGVSQVVMCVSSQSSERVTGEISFAKAFRNVF